MTGNFLASSPSFRRILESAGEVNIEQPPPALAAMLELVVPVDKSFEPVEDPPTRESDFVAFSRLHPFVREIIEASAEYNSPKGVRARTMLGAR